MRQMEKRRGRSGRGGMLSENSMAVFGREETTKAKQYGNKPETLPVSLSPVLMRNPLSQGITGPAGPRENRKTSLFRLVLLKAALLNHFLNYLKRTSIHLWMAAQ